MLKVQNTCEPCLTPRPKSRLKPIQSLSNPLARTRSCITYVPSKKTNLMMGLTLMGPQDSEGKGVVTKRVAEAH